jgi:hypothetical protein
VDGAGGVEKAKRGLAGYLIHVLNHTNSGKSMTPHHHIVRGLAVFTFIAMMATNGLSQTPDPGAAAKEPPAPQDGGAFKAKQTAAIMKLRQLGLALFEFETNFGGFPGEETAKGVKEATGKDINLKTDTADDCFRQLLDAEVLSDDKVLTMETPAANKPKPGEPVAKERKRCAFAYCYGMSAAGNPGRPLAFYPLLDGRTTFDLAPLGGRAVVLFVDNSVLSFPIEKDGRVLIRGKDMFDPDQPYWGGKKPVIKWPAK